MYFIKCNKDKCKLYTDKPCWLILYDGFSGKNTEGQKNGIAFSLVIYYNKAVSLYKPDENSRNCHWGVEN